MPAIEGQRAEGATAPQGDDIRERGGVVTSSVLAALASGASVGHLLLKEMLRDLLWEFSVSRDLGQIMMSSAKKPPI